MERRDFLKLSVLTGATVTLSSCEKPAQQLTRFVVEEDFVPGVATWKPSLCTLCPAGCGVIARVSDGDAEVIRNGQHGILRMGLAKKLEGNPEHPVNRGRLCARGQAGLQLTYHPDRLRAPRKRSGPRGSGEFSEITWEEAISEVVSRLEMLRSRERLDRIRFLTGTLRGQRHELIQRFMAALGAPAPFRYDPLDEPVLRQASLLSYGHARIPSFDLARSDYIISFGADFLGTWNSPVAQAIGYGEMRRGRPGSRGKFVQVEQRMSQTGANADEWVTCFPGTEGLLALGLAHVIAKEKLRPVSLATLHSRDAEEQLKSDRYASAETEKNTGVSATRVERLAHEMAARPAAVALIGGTSLAYTNGLFNALAVYILNAVLGSPGLPGGMFFAPGLGAAEDPTQPSSSPEFVSHLLSGNFENAEALFLHQANPVFATPPGWQVLEKLSRIPFIVSFSSFIDETTVLADLILPDHSPLESWLDDVPESGTSQAVLSLAAPALHPLHDTRAMPDVLLEMANKLGGRVTQALPWRSFEEMLKASYGKQLSLEPCHPTGGVEKFWQNVVERGGWWDENCPRNSPKPSAKFEVPGFTPPAFDGNQDEFPFYFQPYISGAFLDGSVAHLPWLQELPDPLSTAMWGAWLEVNPRTAAKLGIEPGDVLSVRSQHGRLEVPVVINPAIAFDVVAMPMGQGHDHFGRYASRRGQNAMRLLAPVAVTQVPTLAWAATRVHIEKIGKKTRLALASRALHEQEMEAR